MLFMSQHFLKHLYQAGFKQRLSDKSVYTRIHSLRFNIGPVVSRGNDNGNIMPKCLSNFLCRLEAVFSRHLPVQKRNRKLYAFRLRLRNTLHRRLTAEHILSVHTKTPEHFAGTLAGKLLVVHHQHRQSIICRQICIRGIVQLQIDGNGKSRALTQFTVYFDIALHHARNINRN